MDILTDSVKIKRVYAKGFEGFRRFRFVHGISVFVPYVSLNNICLCNDEEKGMSCVIQGRFFEADMRNCL